MQTAAPLRSHARWWIDPEVLDLVDPLVDAITQPLAHLAADGRWAKGVVLRAALLHLAAHPASDADAAAIQRHMAHWPTRDLAFRTWEADDEEQARQQQLAADLGLRTADVQALAVRLLAESYGLAVPDWRTDGPPQQA